MCLKNHHESKTVDELQGAISLDINRDTVSLTNAIDNTCLANTISDYQCNQCNQRTDCSKEISIFNYNSDMVCFRLERFKTERGTDRKLL